MNNVNAVFQTQVCTIGPKLRVQVGLNMFALCGEGGVGAFVESKTSPSPKRFESESSPSPKRFESKSSPSPNETVKTEKVKNNLLQNHILNY